MTRPLIVLRPEPGLHETVVEARRLGLTAIAAPLFDIAPVAWCAPDVGEFDAIVAGSANAFRLGGMALEGLRDLPVHAVGDRTAAAARAAGFTVSSIGAGGLQLLVEELRGPLRLLRLAGAERVDLAAGEGVGITELTVYRAVPRDLDLVAAEALRVGAVAVLHSGAAAERFAAECDRLTIDRTGVSLAALALRVAEAAGGGWRDVRTANEIADSALLAMAARLCQ